MEWLTQVRYRVWPFVQQLLGNRFQGFDPVDFHPQVAKVPEKNTPATVGLVGWDVGLVGVSCSGRFEDWWCFMIFFHSILVEVEKWLKLNRRDRIEFVLWKFLWRTAGFSCRVGRLGIVIVEQDLCKHACIDLKVDVKMRCAYSIDIAVEVSHLMLSIHIRYTYSDFTWYELFSPNKHGPNRSNTGDFEVRPPEPHADVHARVEVCGLFADGKSAQRWFGVRGDCLGVEWCWIWRFVKRRSMDR